MAREIKSGLDYFPHDTNALNDEKIEALVAIYGAKGYMWYFVLLERIYRSNNFELDLTDPEIVKIYCKKTLTTSNQFYAILDSAFKFKCFDEQAYMERGVLTSFGIKKRAQVVVNKRLQMRDKYSSKTSLKKQVADEYFDCSNDDFFNDTEDIVEQNTDEILNDSINKKSKISAEEIREEIKEEIPQSKERKEKKDINKEYIYAENENLKNENLNEKTNGEFYNYEIIETDKHNLKNRTNCLEIVKNELNIVKKSAKSVNNKNYDAEFDDFWEKYDKKVDKIEAYKYWKKLSRTEISGIFDALPAYLKSTEHEDKLFRKNPANFLKKRAWENEIIFNKFGDNHGKISVINQSRPNVTEQRVELIKMFGIEDQIFGDNLRIGDNPDVYFESLSRY